MTNPVFYVFDGIGSTLKWMGDYFFHIFFFVITTLLWFGPPFVELLAMNGPRALPHRLWTEWNVWFSLLLSMTIAVNFYFWLRHKNPQKSHVDQSDPPIHFFAANALGGALFCVIIMVMEIFIL